MKNNTSDTSIQSLYSPTTNIPRLSRDYNIGYTRAIQDIQEAFTYIQDDLKSHHKKLTGKLSQELLQCIMESREELRDQVFYSNNHQGFIRWNCKNNKFEYYKPDNNK